MELRETILILSAALALGASGADAQDAASPNAAPVVVAQEFSRPAQENPNTAAPASDVTADDNDPLEPVNRSLFKVNLAIDKALVRPLALGYRYIVPHPVRNSIRNFLNNLDSPPIFVNEILQGEFHEAGVTVARFGVNTTVGVGGLFEVAEDWGLPRHEEDFGQTLGVYGVGEGPYLFLPFIGPAPPRDLAGRVVDYFFDPLTYVHMGNQDYWRYVRVGLDAIDLRERNIETLDEIERTSVDYYASIRSLYRQTRNNEINNGQTNIQNLPNF